MVEIIKWTVKHVVWFQRESERSQKERIATGRKGVVIKEYATLPLPYIRSTSETVC